LTDADGRPDPRFDADPSRFSQIATILLGTASARDGDASNPENLAYDFGSPDRPA
jgi:hypothetical protein